MPFGIAEIDAGGSCIITKHENTKGIVNADTVKCQFLYELQGNIYLNSDVKAYLDDVQVRDLDDDRYVSFSDSPLILLLLASENTVNCLEY